MVFNICPLSQPSYGAYSKAEPSPNGPVINDPNLTVEKIASGLKTPTSMAFLGSNDILVTEKNTGRVMEVRDGTVQDNPVLDVQVANFIERGLLGIDLSTYSDGRTYAFLYYTESGGGKDGDDFEDGVEPVGNMLYRYE
ncbi:MAG: PQQ-dependent sugar dehydrogenase, partial [Thermoproteota archaeon]|nr:PQQ-dependent sugar dehydrogenase [Thermoproteota archaeon]